MKLDENALDVAARAVGVLVAKDPSVRTRDIARMVILAYFNALPCEFSGYIDDNPPERIELGEVGNEG